MTAGLKSGVDCGGVDIGAPGGLACGCAGLLSLTFGSVSFKNSISSLEEDASVIEVQEISPSPSSGIAVALLEPQTSHFHILDLSASTFRSSGL